MIIDLGFGEESATPRMQAIDRAELLASLAVLVGTDRAVASAARVIEPPTLGATVPYLQPLALSAATRKQVSKTLLHDLRAEVATASGEEAAPLERLIRVRPRTLFMIAALVGVLRFAASARERRRQLPRDSARQLGVVGRLRRDVAAHLRRERDRHGRWCG